MNFGDILEDYVGKEFCGLRSDPGRVKYSY
jgi:hypothetical protein